MTIFLKPSFIILSKLTFEVVFIEISWPNCADYIIDDLGKVPHCFRISQNCFVAE